jgi:dTDP-4-amino-4,6-dideoxygalactose transaminase
LALHGGTPVRTDPWPSWPVYGKEEERALVDVLHSGKWGVGGEMVGRLECEYSKMHDARFAVACCNGTVAIQIALIAAGVQPGDEVVTSPYTFMATALAALAIGAVPVFVDVEPGTHNIDPNKIEDAITERTTAIMPVHIGGRPADMDAIREIAERHDLRVVEDAAQGWLGAWRGTAVGAIGDAGTFSFQSSKNLAGGEGGIVLTNDEALFQRAWSYHNCGRKLGGEWYEHATAGLNYRLSEFQAALVLAGLERLPEQQRTRREAMHALERGLAGMEGVLLPDADERVTAHACHIFMVRLDREVFPGDKMPFIRALQAEGVPAHPGYTTSLHRQDFWEWFAQRRHGTEKTWKEVFPAPPSEVELPVCDELCASTIWIKQDVLLAGPDAMNDVVRAFEKVAAAARQGALVAD